VLNVVPKSWFSWDFWLQDPGGNAVGEVRLSSWRERGSVVVSRVTYTIRRDGLVGPFVMQAPDGSVVESAVKPSVLRRQFVLTQGGLEYVLKATGIFRRQYEVFREGSRIGTVVPQSWLQRRARAQFAEEMPATLQAFLIWLSCLLWKRDADAVASG
jgi:hypothetical protein